MLPVLPKQGVEATPGGSQIRARYRVATRAVATVSLSALPTHFSSLSERHRSGSDERSFSWLSGFVILSGVELWGSGVGHVGVGVSDRQDQCYLAVQEAAKQLPGMKRQKAFGGIRTPALGADVTSIRCKGRWLPIGLTYDAVRGVVLTIDGLSGEDGATLQEWIAPITEAVGAEVLVSDDADAFKDVADKGGMGHQVCKKHVLENTKRLVEEL